MHREKLGESFGVLFYDESDKVLSFHQRCSFFDCIQLCGSAKLITMQLQNLQPADETCLHNNQKEHCSMCKESGSLNKCAENETHEHEDVAARINSTRFVFHQFKGI
jgi:hypothetical protein